MPLSPDDQAFRKVIYQKLQDKPLEFGDPLYEPIYSQPGCEDPIEQLESYITLADTESLSLFSGFSGSGKTTELFRLRHRLQQAGYVVLYADARKYLDEGHPLQLSELLFVIAGAFSDALAEHNVDLRTESYWTRFHNWLTTTDVNLKELGFQAEAGAGAAKAGASMKLELTTASTLRQRLSDALSNRVGELRNEAARGPAIQRGRNGQELCTALHQGSGKFRAALRSCGVHRAAGNQVPAARLQYGVVAVRASVQQGARASAP
jgi:hypothetical protein